MKQIGTAPILISLYLWCFLTAQLILLPDKIQRFSRSIVVLVVSKEIRFTKILDYLCGVVTNKYSHLFWLSLFFLELTFSKFDLVI